MKMNNIADNNIDPEVDKTLKVLLFPGQCARLSPFIESAQLFLLTGELPNDQKRYESIQGILNKNKLFINQLAQEWEKTRNEFSSKDYEDKTYLQMYALYYFSVNVCKLQIILHELALRGQIGRVINLIDIGVGTGSTAIAFLDFIYSWGLASELHHEPLPVEEFHLIGLDKSKQALGISSQMVSAYRQALQRRADLIHVGNGQQSPSYDLLQKVIHWSENIYWEEFDFNNQYTKENNGTNLVILSNIWNEFTQTGAKDNVEELFNSLPDGTIIVLLEPGDKNNTTELMRWRADFLSRNPSFISIAPCGENDINPQPNICSKCWASRRESFHQSPLYLAFRKECEKKLGDTRSFDIHQNKLLSWSYVVIQKNNFPSKDIVSRNLHTLIEGGIIDKPQNLRVLGKFYEKQKQFQLIDYPIDQNQNKSEDRNWSEYVKVCPLPFLNTKFVVFERSQGFQIPPLNFGEEIQMNNLHVEIYNNQKNLFKLLPQEDGLTTISPIIQNRKGKDGFLEIYDEKTREIIDDLAYRLFGFPELRAFQHEILSRVMCGENVLGIAATGGGKSECYILPAMILTGLTIVISPLLALMTDQYDQRLDQRYGLGDLATYINGEISFKERQARLKRMELGYYKLVYFTPEQLEQGYILDCLRRANESIGIRYLALDECHCISQWGHDFRPSYLNIVHRLQEYAISPVIIALTATASPRVRDDVCNELGLNSLPVDQGGDVFVYSSNRPEINFEVRVKNTTEDKIRDLLGELAKFQRDNQFDQDPGSALIFMPYTGGNPENIWRYLPKDTLLPNGRYSAGVTEFASYLEQKFKRRIAIYHGKMENKIDEPGEFVATPSVNKKEFGDLSGRTRIQEQSSFINSTSTDVNTMVATKGFGMGIDKPNIRLVIHRTPPTNLEAYAQEAGRAGRDGEMATAILYYSPDSRDYESYLEKENCNYHRHSKSDYRIQGDFLNNHCIRREDVIVMHAFLHQVQHLLEIEGKNGLPNRTYLYFTCDEAIDFFDHYEPSRYPSEPSTSFTWPDFPHREPASHEYPDHKTILDRGHLYNNKKEYIDRILATLFSLRPEMNGRGKMAFLESVQETGAVVKGGKNPKWNQIIHSNRYYGELLRAEKVTELEFKQVIMDGTLIPFAKRLNLSLKEVTSLLNDIRNSEASFRSGVCDDSLLEFKTIAAPLWGPAKGKECIQDWRDYAGAYRRSSTAYADAHKHHLDKPSLNDWFTWKDLSKSKGWEILPGPAFDTNFPEFLDAFMQLHNKWKQDEQASYTRLLTDYIGVDENGQVISSKNQKECLRSVLLGYLESYEVVLDGKCYSCSNCVPDGNYGQYSKELREKAVIRMAPAMIAFFKELKEYKNRIPGYEIINSFFDQISKGETEGQSVYRYFIGWSGRLLDDDPDHLTAKWLRIEGMIRNIIQLQKQEFLNFSKQLIPILPEPTLVRISVFLESSDSVFHDDLSYLKICAQVSKQLRNYNREAECTEKIISAYKQAYQDKEFIFECSSRLTNLYSSSGPIQDPIKYQRWCYFSARYSRNYEDAVKCYGPVLIDWEWVDVEREFIELDGNSQNPDIQAALIVSWVYTDVARRSPKIIEWIKKQPEIITTWPIPAQKAIFPFFPKEIILGSHIVLEAFLAIEKDEEIKLHFSLQYLVSDSQLNPKILQQITRDITSKGISASLVLKQYLDDDNSIAKVTAHLLPYVNIDSMKDLLCWQDEFIKSDSKNSQMVVNYFKSFITALLGKNNHISGIKAYQNIILKYAYKYQDIEQSFILYLLPIYIKTPDLLNNLLGDLSQMDNFGEKISDQVLDAIVRFGNVEILANITCDSLSERWENDIFLVNHIKRYINKIIEKSIFNTIYYKSDILQSWFDWKNDLSQADMLATILMEIWRKVHSEDIETFKILFEILVHSGRSSLALNLVNSKTVINFQLGDRIVTAKEYAFTQKVPKRNDEIPSDYALIARKMLSKV